MSSLLTLQCDNSEYKTSLLSCILTVPGSVQPMGWAAGQMGQEGLEASTQDFPHSHRAGYHSDRPSRPWALLSSFSAVPFWVHTSLGLVEYPGSSGKRTQWCWPRLCSAERAAPLVMVVTGRQTPVGQSFCRLGFLGGKRRKRKCLCKDTKQTRG